MNDPLNSGNRPDRTPIRSFIDRITRADLIIAAIGMLLIATLVQTATVQDTQSDPYPSLVVAQSLIENGTVVLDAYKPTGALDHGTIRFNENDGHYYSFYPFGTTLVSLPFVYVAIHMADMNMMRRDDNMELQLFIVTIVLPLIFLMLYITARHWLDPVSSGVIIFITFLGGPMISSMGTALWSHDFEIFFTCIALLMFIRLLRDHGGRWTGWVFGVLMFLAYLSRPTALLFFVPMLVYLFFRDRPGRTISLKAAGTALALLAAYIFQSHYSGAPMPGYYSMIPPFENILRGLYGISLSHSRGLFIYSPFLAIPLVALALGWRRIGTENRPLVYLASVWALVHFFLIAGWLQWWGGWSFGPRLQVEMYVPLFLITVITWADVSKTWSKRLKLSLVGLYIAFGIFAVFINVRQGLYNNLIQMWNATPNVNLNENDLLDWRYPQIFVSNEIMIRKLNERFFNNDPNVRAVLDTSSGTIVILENPGGNAETGR